MSVVYVALLNQGKNTVLVDVPDFNIHEYGKDIPSAIQKVRDAIGRAGIQLQDKGKPLPVATHPSRVGRPATSIVTLIDIDFEKYRRKISHCAVKKNCTIPAWLNEEAEKAGVNFSAVLQAALKRELRIK